MNRYSKLLNGICLTAFLTALALAGSPPSIKIQGFLDDQSGGTPVPADGTYNMTFTIHDADVGGSLLATVGPTAVDVSDGRYETELPLSPAVFDGTPRYMEITVAGEVLAPRLKIVSVPYAFRSERSETADTIGIVCAAGDVLAYDGAAWACSTLSVCVPDTFVSCYSGPAGTADVGLCQTGTRDCNASGTGYEPCIGEIVPTAELLNGLDDDCDGTTDDGCCADGDGDGFGDDACGGLDCDDGNASVNPGAPELCDGIDNDCNPGTTDGVDEAWLGAGCDGPDADLCLEGTNSCLAGSQVCSDATNDTVEVCDGQDNDCDGTTDEGCNCLNGQMQPCGSSVGNCVTGIQTCTAGSWGPCLGSVDPMPELCDNVDNDCDGTTDEELVQSCGTDIGECVSGTQVCLGGDYGPCEGSIDPQPELCDGVDNSCDGAVDEGCVCPGSN